MGAEVIKIDLKMVYDSITNILNHKKLSDAEVMNLYRFRDKITVSSDFASLVNKDFNGIVMKEFYGVLMAKLRSGKDINLWNGFKLLYRGGYWDLYKGDQMYLDNLDFKLAKKIGMDINVAILIHNSRLNKN
jgi:hypothetical protein